MSIPSMISTNRTGIKLWLKTAGVLLILLAVFFCSTKIKYKLPEFFEKGTVNFSEMNSADVYQTEMIVFDRYAVYNTKECQLYLIGIFDKDDTLKFASLATGSYDEKAVFESVNYYLNDSEQQIGDCVLNGGFTAESFEKFEMDADARNKLKQFYNEMAVSFQQDFNAEQTDMVFSFACSSQADFSEYRQGIQTQNVKWCAICAVLAAGGIAGIVIGVIMSRKDKQRAEEYYNQNGAVYYMPERKPNIDDNKTAHVSCNVSDSAGNCCHDASYGYHSDDISVTNHADGI